MPPVPQPGLTSQVTGTVTHARYWAATIFVDHFSDVFFVSLMRGVSDAETLAAKQAYGHFAALHNVEVKRYHADNLRFNSQSFLEDVTHNNQEITFCGVGAHHQNGIAENGIKRVSIIG